MKKIIGSILFLLSSAIWFVFNLVNGVNGIFEKVLKIPTLRHTFLFEEHTIPVLLCFFIFTVVSLIFAIAIKYRLLIFSHIILFVLIVISYLAIALAWPWLILKIIAAGIILLAVWYIYIAWATKDSKPKK